MWLDRMAIVSQVIRHNGTMAQRHKRAQDLGKCVSARLFAQETFRKAATMFTMFRLFHQRRRRVGENGSHASVVAAPISYWRL